MLYYYEKRKIDTVDEVVDNLITISKYYDFKFNNTNVISSSKTYSVASYAKNGLYYTDRETFINEPGTEYLVYNDCVVLRPPAGMGFSYKIKKTVYSSWDVGGILYKATEAPGSLVSEFISEEGMYPDDGIQGDFWYVKKSRAINFKYKDINGIVYDIAEAKYKDVNGNIVDIASAIYKDSSGNISGTEVVDPEIPTDPEPTDPEIPTEGLVCYLDTRGKTNTDTDRGTLLDLSGNGNHGTLHNFNFTEESGYVKDVSGGSASGLKFDGIDDQLILNLDLSQDFTIFVELNIPATMSGDMRFTITGKEESFYNMTWILIMNNRYAFQLRKKGVEEEYEGHTKYTMRDGLNKIAVRKDGYNITLFLNKEKAEYTLANNLIPDKLVRFEKSTIGEGGELTGIKVYNRALTDEEMQQLMEV